MEDDNEKINRRNKIIITVSVIIIFVFVAITMIFIMITGKKKIANTENKVTEANEIFDEDEEKTHDFSSETIVDNSNAKLNKNFGKVDIIFVDENNKQIDNPEKPQLGNQLTPVKYNRSKAQFERTTLDDSEWYDYSNKKWANAIDTNGNYFVWIPRFAYKITYYSNSEYSRKIGYSDSRGILAIDDESPSNLFRICHNSSGLQEAGNHYIVEPAFMNDTINSFRNGGWSSNIKGFWVAKYEMSMETNKTDINPNTIITNDIRPASKPGVTSWRQIEIGDAFYNSYNFNRELESHMMKNTEWGAIAYLTYSKYGANSYKISNNESRDYLTGGSNIVTEVYTSNVGQSTTQNQYGIYDLSGGAAEYISCYINNSNQYLAYGKVGEGYLLGSEGNTKYKTIYSNVNEEQSYNQRNASLNYRANILKRGDAIIETSSDGYQSTAWNTNSSFFMQYDTPFLIRGGTYADSVSAGLFNYSSCDGQSNASNSFRVCLIY